MFSKRLRSHCLPIMAAVLIGQGACARNPVTGARQLALISEGQEIARLDPDQALSANAPVKLIRPGR